MNETNQNNGGAIAALIASKTATTNGVAPGAKDEVRFIIIMTESERTDLRNLCDAVGEKQIKMASQIFSLALAQAKAELKKAQDAAKAAKAAATTPPVPTTK
jgi:hypothetical protein